MKHFLVIPLFLLILISTVYAQEIFDFTEQNEIITVEKQKSSPFGIIECDKDLYVVKPGQKITALCTVDVESINAVAVFDKIKTYETDNKFTATKQLQVAEKITEFDKDVEKPLGLITKKKTIKIEFEPKSDYGKFDVIINVNKNGEIITEVLDPYWVVDRGVQYLNPTTEYIGSRRFNLSTEWNSNLTTYIKQVKFEVDGVNTTVWDMNGLVGYWSFDEGSGSYAYDKSGNGNSGTLTNMNTTGNATSGWTTNSVYGKALLFDGINDYVNIPVTTSSSINITNSSYSIVFWFYNNKNYSLNYNYMLKWSGVGGAKMEAPNIAWFDFPSRSIGMGNIQNNKWYFIVMINNKTHCSVYKDGILHEVWTCQQPIVNGNLFIGGYSYSFNGTLDEVMIFNRSLSEDEIKQLYLTKAHYFNHTFIHTNNIYINSWKSYACNQVGECNATLEQQYCDNDKYDYKNDGKIYACDSIIGTGNDVRLFASYIRQSTLSSEYPSVNTAVVILIILAIGIAGYALFANINPVTVMAGVVVFLVVLFLLTTVIDITKNNKYPVHENNENLGVFDGPKEFTTSYPIYSVENVYAKNMTSKVTATLVFKND